MTWAWRWLLLAVALTATTRALPVPDDNTDSSAKVLGSSVVTSVSVVVGNEDGADTRKVTDDLPASPVDMLKPDGFQFYTVDDKGQLITRQMTDSEIQSIIAAGGGPFPIEAHDPQKNGDHLAGEMNVADVVQNVQKVLKGELSKPAAAMGAVPTIPGHANDEWSSILPSILGGDTESAPVAILEDDEPSLPQLPLTETPTTTPPVSEQPESLIPETPEVKPQGASEETVKPSSDPEIPPKTVSTSVEKVQEVVQAKPTETEGAEIPMIPVPVIEVESVQSAPAEPSPDETKPVYQILNTISADEVKQEVSETSKVPEAAEGTKNAEKPQEAAQTEAPDSVNTSVPEKLESESKKPAVAEEQSTVVPEMIETEIASSFVPLPHVESNKPEVEAPDTTDLELQKPSTILEAPASPDTEVKIPEPEEKPTPVLPDPLKSTEDKKPETQDKSDATIIPIPPSEVTTSIPQTETSSSTETLDKEVSELVSLLPDSISSIVEELITDSIKSKDPVIVSNEEKTVEAVAEVAKPLEAETKPAESTDNNVKESSVSSEDKNAPAVSPTAQTPTKTEAEVEPVFQMLPEISPESTSTKTVPETPLPTKKTEEPLQTTQEPATSVPTQTMLATSDQLQTDSTPTDKVADKTEADTKATEASDEKKPETLLTELADSVSSMISQISETLPSMVPIPQKTETNDQALKRVETGAKPDAPTTTKNEPVAIEAPKPVIEVVSEVSVLQKIPPSQESNLKPEITAPEPQMTQDVEPQPALNSETTKISEAVIAQTAVKLDDKKPEAPVANATSESESMLLKDKLDTTETKTSIVSEDKKTEEVQATPIATDLTQISQSEDEKAPIKPDEAAESQGIPSKPEESKVEVDRKPDTKPQSTLENEAPIVRIDITEAKPTNATLDMQNDGSTESSVVRIQLTNPVQMINQIIDSAPAQTAPINLANIAFSETTMQEASAQTAASSLIAGAQLTSMPDGSKPEELPPAENATPVEQQKVEMVMVETTPLANDEKMQSEKGNTKVQATENAQIQVTDKESEQVVQKVPEKIAEKLPEDAEEAGTLPPAEEPTQIPEVAAPLDQDAVKPLIRIDIPVPDSKDTVQVAEPPKSESAEKTVEPVAPTLGDKVEESSVSVVPAIVTAESTKVEIPSEETLAAVPPEIVATVDVQVTKDSPLKAAEPIVDDTVKPLISEQKPEATTDTQDNVKSDSQVPVVQVVEPVSTSLKPNEDKASENEVKDSTISTSVDSISSSTQEAVAAPDVTIVQNPATTQKPAESSDIQNELPVAGEKSEVVKESEESAAEPESILNVESEAPSKFDKDTLSEESPLLPESTTTKLEESAQIDDGSTKPAAHVVRIDVSPEKEQPEVPTTVAPLVNVPEKVEEVDAGVEIETKEPVESQPQMPTTISSLYDVPEKVEVATSGAEVDKKTMENNPEKSPSVSSTISESSASVPPGEIKSSLAGTEIENKKPENTDAVAATPDTPMNEITLLKVEDSLKNVDKAEENVVTPSSGVQSAEMEISDTLKPVALEEVTNAVPATDIQTDKVNGILEPEIKVGQTDEESVKGNVSTVESKIPEVTAVPNAPLDTTVPDSQIIKSDTVELSKPVVRIDTAPYVAVNNAPPKTQEIRIQVNDTAVLVTKQPITHTATANDEKKVQPAEIPDSVIYKTEDLSQLSESSSTSNDQKPGLVTDSQEKPQQIDKEAHKTNEIFVKIDSVTSEPVHTDTLSEQDAKKPESQGTKPTADAYLKLGEKLEETPVEKPEQTVEQKPQVKFEQIPEQKLEDKAEQKPQVKLEQIPEQKPEQSSEQKPEQSPKQKPEQKPERKPDVKPEQKPLVKIEQVTEPKPEQNPKDKPEQKPQVKLEQIPEQKPEQKPEQPLEQMSVQTPEQESKKKPVQNSEQKPVQSPVKKPEQDPPKKPVQKPERKPTVGAEVLETPSLSTKKTDTVANVNTEEKWTLIPQSEPYPMIKQNAKPAEAESALVNKNDDESQEVSVNLEAHQSAISLEQSTRDLDKDIGQFSKLCNELAFKFWIAANNGLSTARSLALSPFGMTSMLAMVFLGARGPTSGQMNDVLKLDDVVTFNPHLVFQNVTDSVNLSKGQGIANSAFVRELFADRTKAGRILAFYKERAQQFYDGHVEEVNFATISDLVRRRTNLLIRRQTGGRIRDFVKGNVMPLRSPLAALSANVFQTECHGASSEGRDGEMYFAVLPAVRQRKLVPVPATVWRSGVLAGYEPGLDATVISLGGVDNLASTIFVLPGQQGLTAPGDSLDHLERRLLEGAFTEGVWDKLLSVLIPRMGLDVQIPKFSHRSVVNATAALKRMGLDELFSKQADLKGINGIGNDLHLADMLQINLFSTCGDETITGGRHHVEIYPASPLRGARVDMMTSDVEEDHEEESESAMDEEKDSRSRRSVNVAEFLRKRSTSASSHEQLVTENHHVEKRSHRTSGTSSKPVASKTKQAERPLVKLDRPFLYFVRHNPTGMILHMGRFNPRLMP